MMLEASGDVLPICGSREGAAGSRDQIERMPVLIVLHQPQSTAGHVGRWFRQSGFALDVRRPFEGDPLPSTLAHHSGAVIFGGPQSANDSLDYIRREVDWIAIPLAEERPFLGICLGAQMLALHLGAKVDHCPEGRVEIGYHELSATSAGRCIGGFPERVYQWHREGFELPSGGVLLATSDGPYPNQAFRYGRNAFGVQFHPEITFAQVNHWSGGNPTRLLLRGAQPRERHIDGHLVHARAVHDWMEGFLRQWASGGWPVA